MIAKSELLLYYKRKDVQEAIIRCSEDKEVAVKFGDKGFGKRPDMLRYNADVFEFAKQGATSFHASEEIWYDAMKLDAGLKAKELEDNRKAWDLVLDIDCDFLEYSKIAADMIVKALKFQGVRNISCKFSGRSGFHIGVKHTAFPEKIGDKETRTLFPDGPRAIALYLKEMIKEHLTGLILSFDTIEEISKKSGKKTEELSVNGRFDVFKVLDIDTILISSRHLYRMPYSFNEKSGLVSIPINPDEVLNFDRNDAISKNVVVGKYGFLDSAEDSEGKQLLMQALDYASRKRQEEMQKEEYKITEKKDYEEVKEAIPEECFPPCVKLILNGLKDGKKRAMFVLTNFLSSAGWSPDMIEERLKKWNEKNPEQLRETLLVGQIRYHKQRKQKVLPPNCDNEMYYKGMQVCTPDNLCAKIKNPVNYSIRKARYVNQVNQKGKRKIKKEDNSK